METVKLILPAIFASLFVNNDASGYSKEDLAAAEILTKNYLTSYNHFICSDVDIDNTYFSPTNDMPTMRQIGSDVCEFTFIVKFEE